jgi:hypothetical protein
LPDFYDLSGEGTVCSGGFAMTQPAGLKGCIALGMLLLLACAEIASGTATVPNRYVFNRVDLSVGAQPVSVAAGDFNGDGQLDLAVLYQNSNKISILLGKPDGTFGSPTDVAIPATGILGPKSIVAADFNKDGKLDLAVALGTTGSLQSLSSGFAVLLGNGDGTFQTAVEYATSLDAVSLASADFNGDGVPDIAVATGMGLQIFLANGDGTFRSGATYFPNSPGCDTDCVLVVTGDFNGDGKPDLAESFPSPHTVSILLGVGDGTFQIGENLFTDNSQVQGDTHAPGLAVGDFNGDGIADLAAANSDSVSVLLGDGMGNFQLKFSYTNLDGKPVSVVAADFNRDGKMDIAVSMDSIGPNPGDVLLLLGNGDGTLATPGLLSAVAFDGNPFGLISADFNGDGQPDIAVADEGSSTISVSLNSGGTLLNMQGYATLSAAQSTVTPSTVLAGDFNGDGKVDLLVSEGQNSGYSVLFGNGDGTFQLFTNGPPTGSMAPFVGVTGDFNGDGNLDAVAVSGTTAAILLGRGDGTFGYSLFYGTPPMFSLSLPRPAISMAMAS